MGWVLLLALGILLGIGASAARRGEIALPARFFSLRPSATLSPQDSAPEERILTLPGQAWYALQVGAYAEKDAAEASAAAFRGRGAGGYIHFSDGLYRVLAAAYETRADAQAVQTQLKNQHQVETAVVEILQPELSLRVSGQKAQLASLEDAFGALCPLAGKLGALSAGLDRREKDASQIRPALQSEKTTLDALEARLLLRFGEDAPPAAEKLHSLCADAARGLDRCLAGQGSTALGAQIKYAQLMCLCRMASFAQSLLP